jgi:hypothetical protein
MGSCVACDVFTMTTLDMTSSAVTSSASGCRGLEQWKSMEDGSGLVMFMLHFNLSPCFRGPSLAGSRVISVSGTAGKKTLTLFG